MSRHSTKPSQEQMQEADAMEAIASNNETMTDSNFSVPGHLSSGTITRPGSFFPLNSYIVERYISLTFFFAQAFLG